MALQCVTPNWPRWKITLIAGVITSVVSCFPIIFLRLLDYVAAYGTVLVPMGAFVVAEVALFPRLGIERHEAEKGAPSLNREAAVMWPLSVGLAFSLVFWGPLHIFGAPLAAYLIALIGYMVLRKLRTR